MWEDWTSVGTHVREKKVFQSYTNEHSGIGEPELEPKSLD